ncbi:hypothetical protein ACFLTP_06795 [Chloroflexota bacterium]
MKQLNIWVEITTLVIPNQNDSEEELNQIASFIAKLDKDIPWHISRFHPDYQFTDHISTPIETLRRAREIGKKHELHYVYLGNVLENFETHCYKCNRLLIKRTYMGVEKNYIQNDRCPSCDIKIKGIWL